MKALDYPITTDDEKMARNDPLRNSLEARSLRLIEMEISRLEDRLRDLRFVAATIARHTPTAG